MKLFKNILLTGVLACVPLSSCFAYVYKLSILKKNSMTAPDKSQVIICFSDYHDRTNSHNAQQRQSLESIIKKYKNCKLIVEDLSSVNNQGKRTCCNFVISSEGGLLGKLADAMRASSVFVDNVEYRYCRVAAFGPLLKNKDTDPFAFLSSTTIGFNDLLQEVLHEIGYIKQYDDGLFLNALYKKTTHHVAQECNLWKSYVNQYKNVAEYCEKTRDNTNGELEKMCVFDSALIDMKIMHSIIESPTASIIFVVAGGSHIEKIETLLQSVGYTLLFSSAKDANPGNFLKNEIEIDKAAAGTTIEKKGPPALDLRIVDKLIKQ